MPVSPQIRIDDDVYELLKARAEPFVDTPNSVLRRLLELDGAESLKASDASGTSSVEDQPARASRTRAKSGAGLLQQAFYLPILASLAARGGSATVRDVLHDVERRVGSKLDSVDRDLLTGGETRWRNRAQWARLDLVNQGRLEKNSARGTWTITQAGREYLSRSER